MTSQKPLKQLTDKEFNELKLRAAICSEQISWPEPGNAVWQKLHEAANEARGRVSNFYAVADEIDRNANLSRDDKYRQRSETAAQALADFEASKSLARACQAVELAVAKHNFEKDVSPEIARDSEAMLKARKDVERSWQRAMDKVAERAGRSLQEITPSPLVKRVVRFP